MILIDSNIFMYAAVVYVHDLFSICTYDLDFEKLEDLQRLEPLEVMGR